MIGVTNEQFSESFDAPFDRAERNPRTSVRVFGSTRLTRARQTARLAWRRDRPRRAGRGILVPPIASRNPVVAHPPRRHVDDPYEWFRAKEDAAVIAHLEAENAYTEARTAHLGGLRERIFDEIKGRTLETDLSVPTRRGRLVVLRPHGRRAAVRHPVPRPAGLARRLDPARALARTPTFPASRCCSTATSRPRGTSSSRSAASRSRTTARSCCSASTSPATSATRCAYATSSPASSCPTRSPAPSRAPTSRPTAGSSSTRPSTTPGDPTPCGCTSWAHPSRTT